MVGNAEFVAVLLTGGGGARIADCVKYNSFIRINNSNDFWAMRSVGVGQREQVARLAPRLVKGHDVCLKEISEFLIESVVTFLIMGRRKAGGIGQKLAFVEDRLVKDRRRECRGAAVGGSRLSRRASARGCGLVRSCFGLLGLFGLHFLRH
jgi:hypothetical protein